MFTFITDENNKNSLIIKFYINQLNKLWNEKKYLNINLLLNNINTNRFLQSELKKEIKDLYLNNIKLITLLRKIKLNKIHKNKLKKQIPLNQTTILADYTCLLKNEEFIDIYHGNKSKFYRFQIYEIIKIFETAIYHTQYGFSYPFLPKNPYTNTEFTLKDFYTIYEFLINKNKVPYVFTLLKLSYYDIKILKKKFKNELYNKSIYTYIDGLSHEKFIRKITSMFDTLEINTCLTCLQLVPDYKLSMSKFLREYIHKMNTNRSNDKNLKKSIVSYLKEHSIFNINDNTHQLSHRNIKKYRRKIIFKNQVDLSSIDCRNFKFNSDTSYESIQKFKQQKYYRKKRHERYINRHKKNQQKKENHENNLDDYIVNEIHNIFTNHINDRNNDYHIEISYELNNSL